MITPDELELALAEYRLTLYYQPQISLHDGRVVGAEALVRMRDRDGTLVYPDEFIPAAEESGAITAVTQYLFNRFVDDLAVIHDLHPDLHISMNVSQQDMLEEAFIKRVEKHRKFIGAEKSGFSFEITETSAIDALDNSKVGFSRLLRSGVSLIMDDFGTGYANLYSLTHSPFAKIKIDKSFIQTMLHDEKRMIIVKDSMNLAHRLGMDVVAEGVEDLRTVQALINLGCTQAQGYFFAKALSMDEFLNFVADWTPNFTPSPIGLLYHAESDHLEWRRDLISSAFSFDTTTDDIADLYDRFTLSPTACHFGRWYHGDNMFSSLPSYGDIDEPHSELHFLGHALIKEAIRKNRSREKMIEIARQIADTSLKTLEAMHNLEQEVMAHQDT